MELIRGGLHTHQDYDQIRGLGSAGAANTDIAIIKIGGKFTDTNHTDYLRLYADVSRRLRGEWLSAYGAGVHSFSGSSDNQLRTEEFKVENVKENHIVVDTRQSVGICSGDSGGPLVYSFSDNGAMIPI